MQLTNINTQLYKLNNINSKILYTSEKNNNLILANNNIIFTLPIKKLSKNYEKGKTIISTFETLNYTSEIFQALSVQYPNFKISKYSNFKVFTSLIKIFSTDKMLVGIAIKKKNMVLNYKLFGISGILSIYSILAIFAKLWKQQKYNYKSFIFLMLYWLHNCTLFNLSSQLLKIVSTKSTRTKKKGYKKKSVIIFSSNTIN